MANFLSLGGKFLAASAMTTALSPDKRILIKIMLNNPIQKSVVCKNSIRMTAL
jgi:hypothetical protein